MDVHINRQWKEWCGIIHRWLNGIFSGAAADLLNRLQDGKSCVGCFVQICEIKEHGCFSMDFFFRWEGPQTANKWFGSCLNSEAQQITKSQNQAEQKQVLMNFVTSVNSLITSILNPSTRAEELYITVSIRRIRAKTLAPQKLNHRVRARVNSN